MIANIETELHVLHFIITENIRFGYLRKFK